MMPPAADRALVDKLVLANGMQSIVDGFDEVMPW
jgi:hypothetical protein